MHKCLRLPEYLDETVQQAVTQERLFCFQTDGSWLRQWQKTAEPVFASSEMELLSIIISIFKNTPDIPEELKELKKSDVIVKFSRNKTYDLVSRTSALANLINIGIDPGKAIATVDIFDDAQQTTIDSLGDD